MSADQTVRAYIVAELALPAEWHVIPEQRFPETISRTTVVLQHTRIERLPEAPLGHLRHTVTLTVADPHTDIAAAEDGLDDALTDLLSAIDAHSTIAWTEAEKVVHAERYVAWNLTLTVITGKPAATEPEPVPEPDNETEEV